MSDAPAQGRIVTFYSYKGGTGRSMALANVAWLLASSGKRVLLVDWDLEAPGLHRYFHPFLLDKELTATRGLIDLVWDVALQTAAPAEDGTPADQRAPALDADFLDFAVALRWGAFPAPGRIDLIPAGKQNASYAARVNSFDWQRFYEQVGGGAFLERLRGQMREEYDYVLIDSRTGVSDTAGICTVHMPDLLVVCFTPNTQSIEGAAAVAESVKQQWAAAGRPREGSRIFPVLTRVDTSEKKKLDARKDYARAKFDRYLTHLDSPAELDDYWGRVAVPYVAWYAYEEVLAAFADRPRERSTVLASAEALVDVLTGGEVRELVPPPEEERTRVLAEFTRVEQDQRYDAFLCCREEDTVAVESIARHLSNVAKLRPWFAPWNVRYGAAITKNVQQGLEAASSLVVFIGAAGMSRWMERELDLFLRREAAEPTLPIIPVLLPSAPEDATSRLPAGLTGRRWLDMRRGGPPEALYDLEQAIRGIAPLPRRAVTHDTPGAAAPAPPRSEPRVDRSPSPSLSTGSPPRVSIGRLPSTTRTLVGREAELAWLDDCWGRGVRVASIVAFGGVGKSALVNAWMARLDADGWRGARRVYGWSFYSQGTDRLSSSDAFIEAALRWFGDAEPQAGSSWDKGERLAQLVMSERTLLVLDGVEPLQWGPGAMEGRFKDQGLEALLKPLSVQNAGLCLVTSRIALTDLEGLGADKVAALDLTQLTPDAGAELLLARGVKGTADELRAAAREYKGHPLALTLLGSYLDDVAEGDIRRRHEIGSLEGDDRQGGYARRVIAAYEAWIGKVELAVLHIIGLFGRPASEGEIGALRAAPPIAGLTDTLAGVTEREWKRAVAKLRRVGLLLDDADHRLDAHPLVREHFGEQLRRSAPAAWQEGHRRLYEHLKASAKALPETIEEMGPLYAAVVHGCVAGQIQDAFDEVYLKRIQREQERFSWHKLGAFGSEVAALSAFFDPPWERLAPGLAKRDQAFILNAAGFTLQALGRLQDAAAPLRLGIELAVAQADWTSAAAGAFNLSNLLRSHGDLEESLAQARKGAAFADQTGIQLARITGLTTMGATLHASGRMEEAAACYEEAERVGKAVGQPFLHAVHGYRYCDLLLDQGRDAEVRDRVQQMRAGLNPASTLLTIALEHLALGRAHLQGAVRRTGGEVAQAAVQLDLSVRALRRAGVQEYLPPGLLARALLRTQQEAFDDARRDLDEALSVAQRCGFRLSQADAHLALAHRALAEGAETAREHLARARRIVEETGYHRRDADLAELSMLDDAAVPRRALGYKHELSLMPNPEAELLRKLFDEAKADKGEG